jgi:hypothetical protein
VSRHVLVGIAAVALAALAVAIWRFSASTPGAPLAGQSRADFARSAVEGCLATQRAAARDRPAPEGAIERFCGCYAEALADRVTAAELDRLAGKPPAEIQSIMRDKMRAADDACVNNR